MSSDVTCFDDIIGLSRTPCSDYVDIQSNYTTSDSGIYLDELIPLAKFESVLNCKVGESVFPFMDKARTNAIIDFRIDATAMLTEVSKLKRNPFVGRIGKIKKSSTLNLTTGNYYGMVLKLDDIVGGDLIISNIGVQFDTTSTFNVYVFNNFGLLDTISVSSVADELKVNACNVRLDMHSDYVENLEIYLVYQYNGVDTPYDNVLYNNPCCTKTARASQSNAQFGYRDYMIASGVSLTQVDDLSDVNASFDDRCFGLSLGVSSQCNVEEIWCLNQMDYTGNPVDMAIAKAVSLKAASNLVRDIALSNNLNFDTMIDGETLGTMDERWNLEYSDMISFIVKNIDITKTDCFECGREILGGVGAILS